MDRDQSILRPEPALQADIAVTSAVGFSQDEILYYRGNKCFTREESL